MFVNAEQIQLGISRFVENEIANKAVGFNKFVVCFVTPLATKKITQYVNTLADNPLMAEIFDGDRNVNLDEVYNMAKSAVQKSGQFTYMGMIFNETDIDKLYNYIRG